MKVVFSFMRLQPPTIGHSLVFKRIERLSKQLKADAFICTSKTSGNIKNPLDYEEKSFFIKHILSEKFPSLKFLEGYTLLFDVLKYFDKKYSEIYLVVGSDRLEDLEEKLNKYNHVEYDFEKIVCISAGDRDPDSENVSGVSGTKVRKAVLDNDYSQFQNYIDTWDDDVKRMLFDLLQNNLQKFSKKKIKEAEEEVNSEEEAPSKSLKASDVLKKRLDDFLQKNGVKPVFQSTTSSSEGSSTEESDVEGNEETLEAGEQIETIEKDHPNTLISSLPENIAVLLLEESLGVKSLIDYIRLFLDIYKSSNLSDFRKEGLLLNIRQTRKIKGNYKNIKISPVLPLKISWFSPKTNKEFVPSQDFQIFFSSVELLEILEEFPGKNLTIYSAGMLSKESLQSYVEAYQKARSEKTYNIDIKSLDNELIKNRMKSLESKFKIEENEAIKSLDYIVELYKKDTTLKGSNAENIKKVFKRFLEENEKTYLLDDKIVAFYISKKLFKSKDKKDPSSKEKGSEVSSEELLGLLGLEVLTNVVDPLLSVGHKKEEIK